MCLFIGGSDEGTPRRQWLPLLLQARRAVSVARCSLDGQARQPRSPHNSLSLKPLTKGFARAWTSGLLASLFGSCNGQAFGCGQVLYVCVKAHRKIPRALLRPCIKPSTFNLEPCTLLRNPTLNPKPSTQTPLSLESCQVNV